MLLFSIGSSYQPMDDQRRHCALSLQFKRILSDAIKIFMLTLTLTISLPVQNSSIGDSLTHWVSHHLILVLDPGDLWLLRHLIRVMGKHDMTNILTNSDFLGTIFDNFENLLQLLQYLNLNFCSFLTAVLQSWQFCCCNFYNVWHFCFDNLENFYKCWKFQFIDTSLTIFDNFDDSDNYLNFVYYFDNFGHFWHFW